MVSFHIRNTTMRPIVLDFLKRPARLEKAGTRFDSITVKLSELDTSKRRPTEQSLQMLLDNGCEIYLDTELKRLVPVAKPAMATKSAVNPQIVRNLEKAMAQTPGDPIKERTIFQGTPGVGNIGLLPGQAEQGRTVTISKEAPMSQVPGMKKGQTATISFDLEAMEQRRRTEAKNEKATKAAEAAAAIIAVPAPVPEPAAESTPAVAAADAFSGLVGVTGEVGPVELSSLGTPVPVPAVAIPEPTPEATQRPKRRYTRRVLEPVVEAVSEPVVEV